MVAYSVYSTTFGFHTLFATPASLASYEFDPARLPLFAVLGIVCAAGGILFAAMYRWTVVGGVSHDLLPALGPLAFVPVFSIVGMMSFFGGISKAPRGVSTMVVEMAGTYTILPAAMLSIFVGQVATGRFHIYSEQLPSRIQSPAHLQEYRTYFLSEIPVGEIAKQDPEPVLPSMTVRQALDIAVVHGHAHLSVEEDGEWFGDVRLVDLVRVDSAEQDELRMIDALRPVDLVFSSDLSAADALRRMDEVGTNVAVVVSSESPIPVVGVVTRRGIRNPTLAAASVPRN